MTSTRPANASSRLPLRRAQVLEPVGVDGPAVPGGEIAGEPLGGVAAAQVAVPEPEPVELGAVAAVELGEIAVERRPGRAGPPRARRSPCRARRRNRRSAPSGRARRASPRRRRGAGRARAARRRRPAARRRSRRRSGRRRRRRSRSSRRSAPRSGRAGRARPVRRPIRSARSGPARGRCPRGSDREEGRPCRRSPARPATSRPSAHTSPGLRRLFLRAGGDSRNVRETERCGQCPRTVGVDAPARRCLHSMR